MWLLIRYSWSEIKSVHLKRLLGRFAYRRLGNLLGWFTYYRKLTNSKLRQPNFGMEPLSRDLGSIGLEFDR